MLRQGIWLGFCSSVPNFFRLDTSRMSSVFGIHRNPLGETSKPNVLHTWLIFYVYLVGLAYFYLLPT
jgi:hypothetical protein